MRAKKWMLVLYLVGFLLGVLYVNTISSQYFTEDGIFEEYFSDDEMIGEIVIPQYFIYLSGIRLIPFALLVVVAFTKFRKIGAVVFLVWTGFTIGMLITMSVLSAGIKGLWLCFLGMVPHFVFYAFAYLIVLWHCMTAPRYRWNKQKTMVILCLMLIGLLSEATVNPVVMQWFF